MPTTTIDPYKHPNESTCVVCGSHRPACCYPPVCCEACRNEWDIETGFNQWAKEFEKAQKDLPPGVSELVDKHFWELI